MNIRLGALGEVNPTSKAYPKCDRIVTTDQELLPEWTVLARCDVLRQNRDTKSSHNHREADYRSRQGIEGGGSTASDLPKYHNERPRRQDRAGDFHDQ